MKESVIGSLKAKANLSILNFNEYMDKLKSDYEFNKYSPGGMLVSTMVAKGRPLTHEERIEVYISYKKIKRLDDLAAEN